MAEIVEGLEEERNGQLSSSQVEEIDSGIKATSLSPKLHSMEKKNNGDKNKHKIEDTALCQHIKVNIKPSTKFKNANERQVDSFALSIEMIGNDIWVCCIDGIHVLSTELEELHLVPCGDMGGIGGATDTGSGVVVAANHGLFRLSYRGKQEARFDTRRYRDVCFSSHQIFATLNEKPYGIEVYDAQTRQHQRSIPVRCPGDSCGDHVHTLTIHSQHIFIACSRANNVYKYALDGTMILKYSGFGGNFDFFDYPYICHTNTQEHVVVADWRNNRVQMLCDGDWHKLQLEPPPQKLCDAILTQQALYELEWPDLKQKITKYEIK